MQKFIVFFVLFQFLSGSLIFSQNTLNPSKLIVFTDGAQLTVKGNIRFDQQKAVIDPGFEFTPGSLEPLKGSNFEVKYLKMVLDTHKTSRPASNWSEVLASNINKTLTVAYELANEWDEVTGELTMLDPSGQIFSLKTSSGKQIFIPVANVRHIIVEAGGIFYVNEYTLVKALEIGITKDLQFAPIEMTGSIGKISWTPTCKLKLIDDKVARYQLTTVIENSEWNFAEIEMELTPASLFDAKPGEAGSNESYKVGKTALKKGQELLVNLKETNHEYQETFMVNLPWEDFEGRKYPKFSVPADYYLRFANNPLMPSSACKNLMLTDANNRIMATVPLENITPEGFDLLKISEDYSVKVEFSESEIKRQPQPIKINERQYVKAEMLGRINIINTRPNAISIKVIRSLVGNITDNGGGIVEGVTLTKEGIVNYQVIVRPKSNREILYKYEALVPFNN